MNTEFIPYGMNTSEMLRYHGHSLPAAVAEALQAAIDAEAAHEKELADMQDTLDKAEAAADTADDKLRHVMGELETALGDPDAWPKIKKAGLLAMLAEVNQVYVQNV